MVGGKPGRAVSRSSRGEKAQARRGKPTPKSLGVGRDKKTEEKVGRDKKTEEKVQKQIEYLTEKYGKENVKYIKEEAVRQRIIEAKERDIPQTGRERVEAEKRQFREEAHRVIEIRGGAGGKATRQELEQFKGSLEATQYQKELRRVEKEELRVEKEELTQKYATTGFEYEGKTYFGEAAAEKRIQLQERGKWKPYQAEQERLKTEYKAAQKERSEFERELLLIKDEKISPFTIKAARYEQAAVPSTLPPKFQEPLPLKEEPRVGFGPPFYPKRSGLFILPPADRTPFTKQVGLGVPYAIKPAAVPSTLPPKFQEPIKEGIGLTEFAPYTPYVTEKLGISREAYEKMPLWKRGLLSEKTSLFHKPIGGKELQEIQRAGAVTGLGVMAGAGYGAVGGPVGIAIGGTAGGIVGFGGYLGGVVVSRLIEEKVSKKQAAIQVETAIKINPLVAPLLLSERIMGGGKKGRIESGIEDFSLEYGKTVLKETGRLGSEMIGLGAAAKISTLDVVQHPIQTIQKEGVSFYGAEKLKALTWRGKPVIYKAGGKIGIGTPKKGAIRFDLPKDAPSSFDVKTPLETHLFKPYAKATMPKSEFLRSETAIKLAKESGSVRTPKRFIEESMFKQEFKHIPKEFKSIVEQQLKSKDVYAYGSGIVKPQAKGVDPSIAGKLRTPGDVDVQVITGSADDFARAMFKKLKAVPGQGKYVGIKDKMITYKGRHMIDIHGPEDVAVSYSGWSGKYVGFGVKGSGRAVDIGGVKTMEMSEHAQRKLLSTAQYKGYGSKLRYVNPAAHRGKDILDVPSSTKILQSYLKSSKSPLTAPVKRLKVLRMERLLKTYQSTRSPTDLMRPKGVKLPFDKPYPKVTDAWAIKGPGFKELSGQIIKSPPPSIPASPMASVSYPVSYPVSKSIQAIYSPSISKPVSKPPSKSIGSPEFYTPLSPPLKPVYKAPPFKPAYKSPPSKPYKPPSKLYYPSYSIPSKPISPPSSPGYIPPSTIIPPSPPPSYPPPSTPSKPGYSPGVPPAPLDRPGYLPPFFLGGGRGIGGYARGKGWRQKIVKLPSLSPELFLFGGKPIKKKRKGKKKRVKKIKKAKKRKKKKR